MRFSIKNRKGLEIVGDVSIPENPIGLAFVMHGLGGFRTQYHIAAIANTFFSYNYTVVNFDATNSTGESGGKYEDATVQNHYEDLVDVIIWSRTQEWYLEPFVLSGASLGGYAATRYAEENPQEVKALFPQALFISGELSYKATEQYEPIKFKEWKETGWHVEESVSHPGLIKRLPWSHMEERLLHDVRPNASKLTMPVLFIVGSKDKQCTSGNQKVLYDLIPGPKEFHIVENAPHDFREPAHLDTLKKILSDWIEKLK